MTDWVVYILRCADGTFYTGITNNLDNRLQKHANGTAAKYTRSRGPHTVVFTEACPDKSTALKREIEIKSLTKAQKILLVSQGHSDA